MRRVLVAIAAAALLVGFPTGMVSTVRASATESCVDFPFASGAVYHCYVPAGVTEITFVVVGGNGGNARYGDGIGGRGAAISGTLTVVPGDELQVTVGGNGWSYDVPGTPATVWSGGGGGYSSIALVTDATVTPHAVTPLVVAGGGGGAGISYPPETVVATPGDGGDAGIADTGAAGGGGGAGGVGHLNPALRTNGLDGELGPEGGLGGGGSGGEGGSYDIAGKSANGYGATYLYAGGGGSAFRGTGGGTAGPSYNAPGGFAGGGRGGMTSGGGGAGYAGGGGGGNGGTTSDVEMFGGGGGGGSSLVPFGATAVLSTGNPQVAISLIDETAPTLTLQQRGTADPTNDSPVEFELVADEALDTTTVTAEDFSRSGGESFGTISCTGSPTTCTIPVNVAGDGTVMIFTSSDFSVEDLFGNVQTTAGGTDRSITYDATAPDVSAAVKVKGASVIVTVALAAGDTAECKLDGGSYTACNPSIIFASTSKGEHTVYVRVTDPAGNTSTEWTSTITIKSGKVKT